MQTTINALLKEARSTILETQDLKNLERLRVYYLGKKGVITQLLQQLGKLPVSERPQAGQILNQAKQQITQLLNKRRDSLQQQQLAQALVEQTEIDITLPGRGQTSGNVHPITRVRERLEELFLQLGFQVVEGPEIEEDYYNFTALNMPAYHPARAMHDTFYFADQLVLRTHTSPVQIRAMKKTAPPIRMITPGRVYRCDSDQTHTPMFHQLEGLWVDEQVTFADLKGLLQYFLQQFFEREFPLRFRPSYFPFVEPGAEVDMRCVCEGKDIHCRICKQTGWLEILGCGMVHPKVLAEVGVDSERYQGFAFGLGIDRLAMLRYGIPDLRLFFENDVSFLEQF